MDHEPVRRLIRSLRTRAEPASAGLGDGELLERFVTSRDEAAFELLLWRHGAMVLGMCRRLLRDQNDAEDAFQATFLALARKAGAIANREAVGAWLYQVAYRVALRARADRARRARREQPLLDQPMAPAPGEAAALDLREALDEEVHCLPARHRAAFVLCCLEGMSNQEAGRQLGCPPGTVSSRLARARQRLRRRLARRGLTPEGWLPVPLPAGLVGLTLKAALGFTAGRVDSALPARAVAYAEGVLRAMFLTRLKVAAFLILAVGLLAAGGVMTHQALRAEPPGEARAAPVVVGVVKPQPGGLARTTRQICRVQASEREEVFAVVSGVLKGLTVDIGDRVKKGQVLAQIDAPLLALAEKEAAAALKQARGLVREAQARVAVARAEVKAAKGVIRQREAEVDGAKSAVAEYQRRLTYMKNLGAAISKEEYFATSASLATSKAQVAAATAALANAKVDVEVKEHKVSQAEAAVTTATATVEVAEVALERARHSLALTRIVAPFAGVVTQRNYRNGHYLRSDAGATERPLLTLQRIDSVRVVVEVGEYDTQLTAPGIPVDLRFDTLPDPRITGCTVSRVGFALDPKTGSMRVEIDVANPRQQLRPGMSGAATLHLKKASPRAFRLPVSCLAGAVPGAKQAVYVVKDGKAQRTPVEVGTRAAGVVEVLSGLKSTDLVVADAKGLTGETVAVEVKEKPGAK
jgi:RND family efflux transporter MFP subunit